MQPIHFIWFALGFGLLLLLVLARTGALESDAPTTLPLLTLLFMAEFGFFLNGAAAVFGVRSWLRDRMARRTLYAAIASALLALCFLLLGFVLWGGLAHAS